MLVNGLRGTRSQSSDNRPVSQKVTTVEAQVRQSAKLGVVTIATAAVLFGGASMASAHSEGDPDPEVTDVCGDEVAEQIICQIGEGNESVTIHQANNVTIHAFTDDWF
jgi:hypothetical protein